MHKHKLVKVAVILVCAFLAVCNPARASYIQDKYHVLSETHTQAIEQSIERAEEAGFDVGVIVLYNKDFAASSALADTNTDVEQVGRAAIAREGQQHRWLINIVVVDRPGKTHKTPFLRYFTSSALDEMVSEADFARSLEPFNAAREQGDWQSGFVAYLNATVDEYNSMLETEFYVFLIFLGILVVLAILVIILGVAGGSGGGFSSALDAISYIDFGGGGGGSGGSSGGD